MCHIAILVLGIVSFASRHAAVLVSPKLHRERKRLAKVLGRSSPSQIGGMLANRNSKYNMGRRGAIKSLASQLIPFVVKLINHIARLD